MVFRIDGLDIRFYEAKSREDQASELLTKYQRAVRNADECYFVGPVHTLEEAVPQRKVGGVAFFGREITSPTTIPGKPAMWGFKFIYRGTPTARRFAGLNLGSRPADVASMTIETNPIKSAMESAITEYLAGSGSEVTLSEKEEGRLTNTVREALSSTRRFYEGFVSRTDVQVKEVGWRATINHEESFPVTFYGDIQQLFEVAKGISKTQGYVSPHFDF